jgi:hypothetical protein
MGSRRDKSRWRGYWPEALDYAWQGRGTWMNNISVEQHEAKWVWHRAVPFRGRQLPAGLQDGSRGAVAPTQ